MFTEVLLCLKYNRPQNCSGAHRGKMQTDFHSCLLPCSDWNSLMIDFPCSLTNAKLRGTCKRLLPKPLLCFSFTFVFICIFILYRQSAAILAVGLFISAVPSWQAAFHYHNSLTRICGWEALLVLLEYSRFWFCEDVMCATRIERGFIEKVKWMDKYTEGCWILLPVWV